MNKKLIFTVFALSIVAAILTMAQQAREGNGGMMQGIGMMGTPSMEITPRLGTAKVAAPVGDMNIGMVETSYMPQYQYGGDALGVVDRVQDKYSHQGVLVKNVSEYMKTTKAYLISIGGKVLSSSQQTSNGITYASMQVKVPTESFDTATSEIAAKADRVIDESINAQDVTGQGVSLEEQIQELNKNILDKQAEVTAAKTDAEKKRLQYDLDYLKKQLAGFEKSQTAFAERVQYATVSVTAADTMKFYDPSASLSLWDEVKQAIRSLGGSSAALARLAVWMVVYAVIWLPLVFGARFIWTRLTHKV